MPAMDKAKIDDLKETIALARKRELAYGLCLGKKAEGTYLTTHKTKPSKALGQEAKSNGETGHFTFGRLSVKGKDLSLTVEGKMLSGLARKLKMWLKAAGQPMKVHILDPEGNTVEADLDDEDEADGDRAGTASAPAEESQAPEERAAPEEPEAPRPAAEAEPEPEAPESPASDPAPDPALVARWEATQPKIDMTLAKFAETPGVDMSQPDALWEGLQKNAADGEYELALAGVPKLTDLLKSMAADVAKAAEAGEELRKQWEQAQVKVTPHLEEIRAAGHPGIRKLDALWTAAQGQAAGDTPDYKSAMKAVGMIAQQIAKIRKDIEAKQAQAPSADAAADGGDGIADPGVSEDAAAPPAGDTPPAPAPDAAPGPEDAPDPAAASAPPSGPSSAAPPPQPEADGAEAPLAAADLSGDASAKVARIEAKAEELESGPIKTYNDMITGAVSTAPADWTKALTEARAAASTAKASPEAADEAALDAALKALTTLEGTIRTKAAEKSAFKKALEVHDLRMMPVNAHPEAGTAPISTDIAAIVAERTAALALSQSHDNPGAAKKLDPLEAKIAAVELRADDLQHFNALKQLRSAMHNSHALPSGDAQMNTDITALNKLFTDAEADATAGRFKDAIAKLDAMPALNDKIDTRRKMMADYTTYTNNYQPRVTAINAKPAAAKAVVQVSVDDMNTRYTSGLIANTNDYKLSMDRIKTLFKVLDFLESELVGIEAYQALLPLFETQLATFKGHDGADGIADIILTMERDLEGAKAESDAKRNATAWGLLNRSRSQWPSYTAMAQAYKTYSDKRKTVQAKIDGLKPKPEAASVLKQAEDLMSIAVTQSGNKEFAAALTTVNEAETRADEAAAAAKAQTDLAGMEDKGALDNMAADWAAAYKVFTDMRAKVVADDTANAFGTLIATADTPAGEAVKSKDAGKFEDARGHLDKAIESLKQTQKTVLFHAPYVTHLAAVEVNIAALSPLNVDDSLKPQIDAAKALVTQAKDLVKPAGYDYPGAEAKLTEADKICVKATNDAGIYSGIRPKLVNARAAIAAVDAAAANVKTILAHRKTEVQDLIGAVDDLIKNSDFGAADKKADLASGMLAATNNDVAVIGRCLNLKKLHYDDKKNLIEGPGKEAGANALIKVNAKLKAYQDKMDSHDYEIAEWMVYDVKFAVEACEAAIKAEAVYRPIKTAAKTDLDAVVAVRNARVETEVAALEAKFAEAEAFAAKDEYIAATRRMEQISEPAKALLPIAQAFATYEPSRAAAEAKLAEARGNAHADAIDVQIARLQGKYDNAVAYADRDDYPTAKAMMDEVTSGAGDAISSAKVHALVDAVNSAVGGDEDSAPWWPQVQVAKGLIKAMELRDTAKVAGTYFATAWAGIAKAENKDLGAKAQKAGLLEAMAANTAADEIITQHTFAAQSIASARDQITALAGHAQGAYVSDEIGEMRAALDAAETLAATGQNFAKLSTDLEAIMDKFHATRLIPDKRVEYLAMRASTEVEPRLAVLEGHDHRYAIKSDIDAMRTKLQEAAAKDQAHDIDGALEDLKAARKHGLNGFVLAQMQDNQPPTEDEVKAILARPGGDKELDAMIDKLEPEAQRKVVKVVFAARFGCNVENFTNPDPTPANLVPDGAQAGPNVVAFYQAMEDLPNDHTLDNDSMANFSIADSGGGSFYRGSEKRVVMAEGEERFSSAYHFGTEREVGKPEDADTPEEREELEKCQPANQDPVNYFNWNTLHEVGHAVDDKNGFMTKNGKGPAYGGWTEYGLDASPIAKILAKKFEYDEDYILAFMAKNNTPPLPEKPATETCSDEEWERRRIEVRGYLLAAFESNKPWRSMAVAQKLSLDGTVYQESYVGRWFSYKFDERKKAITGYQFRAPGEWFSELYAAYHSDKLKPNHPAVSWLSKL